MIPKNDGVCPNKNTRIGYKSAFIIDETQIQIGSDEAWLLNSKIEPIHHRIFGIYISRHRDMLVAAIIISWISLVKLYMANIYSASRLWGSI